VTIDIRNVRFWGNSGHVRVPWNFTRCMLALSPEQAAPLWQADHHPDMYLVGKVISVGLERLADRACAHN